jgi:hypothetical protein
MKFWRVLKYGFVGVIAVMVFLALFGPGAVKPSAQSKVNACLANMRQLQTAKVEWAKDHGKKPMDVPTDAELFGSGLYLRAKPYCPEDGTYELGPVSMKPTCTRHFPSPKP